MMSKNLISYELEVEEKTQRVNTLARKETELIEELMKLKLETGEQFNLI